MMTKKFTDEEIIKALECCIKSEKIKDCLKSECHFSKEWGLCPGNELQKLYLDLINRQKAEIERLNKKVEELSDILSGTIRIRYAKAKAEAYKEFAEKLKDAAMSCLMGGKYYKIITTRCIDTLLKEMAGEK